MCEEVYILSTAAIKVICFFKLCRFLNVKLAYVFASPFDGTMETASIIAEGKGGLLVKVLVLMLSNF